MFHIYINIISDIVCTNVDSESWDIHNPDQVACILSTSKQNLDYRWSSFNEVSDVRKY